MGTYTMSLDEDFTTQHSPLSIFRYYVSSPQFSVDLFETNMNGVIVQLGLGNLSTQSGRKSRYVNTRGLITPSGLSFTRTIWTMINAR
jgi:hypothetical protein